MTNPERLDSHLPVRWMLTKHAREQAAERGVALDEVYATLDSPSRSHPDRDFPDLRVYAGNGIVLVVNEGTRVVVTVMLEDATKDDWEQKARSRLSLVPMKSEPVKRTISRRNAPVQLIGRRIRENERDRVPYKLGDPANILMVKLARLHPAVREGVEQHMARTGLGAADIRIISPTQVEFLR